MAQVDQKVGPPAPVRKERRIDRRRVKAAHRAGVQPQQACGNDQVGALQRAVAQGRLQRHGGVVGEHVTHGRHGCKLRGHMLVKAAVESHDGSDRCGHGFLGIASAECRFQPGLGLSALDKHQPQRLAVQRGRAPLEQLVQLVQLIVADHLRGKAVDGAGAAKGLVQRRRGNRSGNGNRSGHRKGPDWVGCRGG